MAEEKTFFQHGRVTITSSRFTIDSQTFAMSDITSVKASIVEPRRLGPIVLIVLGVIALAFQMFITAFFFGGIGALWFYSQKIIYHIMLTTADGETSAFKSERRQYVQQVVQALNDAIVARG